MPGIKMFRKNAQFVSKKKPFVQKNRLMDLLVLECNHKKKAGFDYEFKIRINHQ